MESQLQGSFPLLGIPNAFRPVDCFAPQFTFQSYIKSETATEEEFKGEKMSPDGLDMSSETLRKESVDVVEAHKHHACNVCGKVLSSLSSYYVHMKQHSGSKPYQCPVCDVRFCRKPYLEVHMRTHTGEKPFQCNVCCKRFTQKCSLNIHKRAHTGERPYSCNVCDKTFAVKSYLDAHRWTHVVEKPLNCDHCRIPFTSRAQYVIHMKSHSPNLTFICPCGRSFAKDSYLIRHQIKVHKRTYDLVTTKNYLERRDSDPNLNGICEENETRYSSSPASDLSPSSPASIVHSILGPYSPHTVTKSLTSAFTESTAKHLTTL